jgi:hypothetical protein
VLVVLLVEYLTTEQTIDLYNMKKEVTTMVFPLRALVYLRNGEYPGGAFLIVDQTHFVVGGQVYPEKIEEPCELADHINRGKFIDTWRHEGVLYNLFLNSEAQGLHAHKLQVGQICPVKVPLKPKAITPLAIFCALLGQGDSGQSDNLLIGAACVEISRAYAVYPSNLIGDYLQGEAKRG